MTENQARPPAAFVQRQLSSPPANAARRPGGIITQVAISI